MGGFYHSVLTAHQLLKGIQSNIQKNGGGQALRVLRNACLFEELKTKQFLKIKKLFPKGKLLFPKIKKLIIFAVPSRKLCEVGHFVVKPWVALMI